ncbi:hypothetical protein MY04_0866 [Flammeovirga sp. MY04]|uniref:hypothetical protein n=1 Tax=Flammeovirga sp. MY04 TaxID=1191459 RepID=UPI0008062F5F|nr:hypothetical protein [Flammeovirga sp. MY04]ANQ48248.1 hypothetical protein MY04_0866 [Flammeovirga sp. MY04]
MANWWWLFDIFLQRKKLTLKRHLVLDPNYFPLDDAGKLNYKEGKWAEVVEDFMMWVEKVNVIN